MKKDGTVVAVFADHHPVEAAVKRLAEVGFDKKNLSVVGKGYHTNKNDGGFYSTGDRIKFWGELGTFWGGLLGWFGGLFLTIPVVGHVIVLGSTAAIFISVIESAIEGAIGGAIAAGGLSALGAALCGIGIPKDSAIAYEEYVKTDRFLVMAHGSAEEVERGGTVLKEFDPLRLDVHKGAKTPDADDHPAHAEG